MLREAFAEAAGKYAPTPAEVEALWREIEREHTRPKRFYHTLAHLEHLLAELEGVKEHVKDWDCTVFSIAYHDIVYNTLRHDNEEKSAARAVQRLTALSFPAGRIDRCAAQIRATKGHAPSADSDLNFFTDADLSILGAEEITYRAYVAAIRQEYAYYPDLLYKPGRKKVLQHFLSMDRIFKTENFFLRFETQARANLNAELEGL